MEWSLIVGFLLVGWLVPEFCVAMGRGLVRFEVFVNCLSALGFAMIAAYIAF